MSPQGKRDADRNSTTEDLIFSIVEVLKAKQPRCWLVENVANFAQQFVHLLKDFLDAIHMVCLDYAGKPMYDIRVQVLNPRIHAGLPQNRPRIYIIGLERRYLTSRRKFRWPNPMPMRSIRSVLDKVVFGSASEVWAGKENQVTPQENFIGALDQIANDKLDANAVVGDLGGGWKKKYGKTSQHLTVGYSPCLTKTRCSQRQYFYFGHGQHHFLGGAEFLRLQGFDDKLKRPKEVTVEKFNGMIGNAWAVDVVERLCARIFVAVGLLEDSDVGENTRDGFDEDLKLPFEY